MAELDSVDRGEIEPMSLRRMCRTNSFLVAYSCPRTHHGGERGAGSGVAEVVVALGRMEQVVRG